MPGVAPPTPLSLRGLARRLVDERTRGVDQFRRGDAERTDAFGDERIRGRAMHADADAQHVVGSEALRQQLFNERITSFGQGYLQELIGDALIVER